MINNSYRNFRHAKIKSFIIFFKYLLIIKRKENSIKSFLVDIQMYMHKYYTIPKHTDFLQKICWNFIKKNIKKKYHRWNKYDWFTAQTIDCKVL